MAAKERPSNALSDLTESVEDHEPAGLNGSNLGSRVRDLRLWTIPYRLLPFQFMPMGLLSDRFYAIRRCGVASAKSVRNPNRAPLIGGRSRGFCMLSDETTSREVVRGLLIAISIGLSF